MDITRIKDGMKVRVLRVTKTNRTYGSNEEMRQMVGKIYEVESHYIVGNEVVVNGFCWHPEDLNVDDPLSSEPSEAMMQGKKTFNPEELMEG